MTVIAADARAAAFRARRGRDAVLMSSLGCLARMAKHRARAIEEGDDDLAFGGWRDWQLVIVGGTIFWRPSGAVVQFALANRDRDPVQVNPIDAAMLVVAALVIAGAIGALKRWWSS